MRVCVHVCVDSLEKDINDTMRNHYLPTSESESWTASLASHHGALGTNQYKVDTKVIMGRLKELPANSCNWLEVSCPKPGATFSISTGHPWE